jgi:hypothetical protein
MPGFHRTCVILLELIAGLSVDGMAQMVTWVNPTLNNEQQTGLALESAAPGVTLSVTNADTGEAVMPQSMSVPTYLPEQRFAPTKAVWDAWDAFGVRESEWAPYWSNGNLVDTYAAEDIHVSLWRKPSSWLMVVWNLTSEQRDARVRVLSQEILPASARDAVSGEILSMKGDLLAVPLDGGRMRLIRLERQ